MKNNNSESPQSEPVKKKWYESVGCVITLSGLVFAFFPIIIAVVMVPLTCGGNANESNCGAAAAPWLLFMTIPIGILIMIAGAIAQVFSKPRKVNVISDANLESLPTSESDRGDSSPAPSPDQDSPPN